MEVPLGSGASVVTYVGMGAPAAAPVIRDGFVAGTQAALWLDGDPGPDYRLVTSPDLNEWTTVLTTNPPALPVLLIDSNDYTDRLRFYRVEFQR